MAGSMRTFVTDGQTDRQTDGGDYIGPGAGPKKDCFFLNRRRPLVVTDRNVPNDFCDIFSDFMDCLWQGNQMTFTLKLIP